MQSKWQRIQDGTSEKTQWIPKRVILTISAIEKPPRWAEQGDWNPKKEPNRTSRDEEHTVRVEKWNSKLGK